MIKSYSSSLRARTFLEKVLQEFDVTEPEKALHLLRRMKQLLATYHEERKKLHRLGLEEVDDVFDVMLGMKRRTEKLQDRLDAYREVQDKLHAIQEALEVDAPAEETVDSIQRISKELEALYEEREVLSRAGVSDTSEAIQLIQSMRHQLDEVYEEMDSEEETALNLIEEELGVSDPESVIEMVENMEGQLNEKVGAQPSTDPARPETPGSGGSTRSIVVRTLERQMLAAQRGEAQGPTNECAPLLSPDTLETLDEQPESALHGLDVGVVALDDENAIRLATTQIPLLPGLDEEAIGNSFFSQVPSAKNPLLQAPIQHGHQTGRLDARFIYTFPRQQSKPPLPLHLHLYRSSETTPLWILYDAVE